MRRIFLSELSSPVKITHKKQAQKGYDYSLYTQEIRPILDLPTA